MKKSTTPNDATVIYTLRQEVARLKRKIAAGPAREWLEVDDPDVIECMGSAPACAKQGCQLRKLIK